MGFVSDTAVEEAETAPVLIMGVKVSVAASLFEFAFALITRSVPTTETTVVLSGILRPVIIIPTLMRSSGLARMIEVTASLTVATAVMTVNMRVAAEFEDNPFLLMNIDVPDTFATNVPAYIFCPITSIPATMSAFANNTLTRVEDWATLAEEITFVNANKTDSTFEMLCLLMRTSVPETEETILETGMLNPVMSIPGKMHEL